MSETQKNKTEIATITRTADTELHVSTVTDSDSLLKSLANREFDKAGITVAKFEAKQQMQEQLDQATDQLAELKAAMEAAQKTHDEAVAAVKPGDLLARAEAAIAAMKAIGFSVDPRNKQDDDEDDDDGAAAIKGLIGAPQFRAEKKQIVFPVKLKLGSYGTTSQDNTIPAPEGVLATHDAVLAAKAAYEAQHVRVHTLHAEQSKLLKEIEEFGEYASAQRLLGSADDSAERTEKIKAGTAQLVGKAVARANKAGQKQLAATKK